MKRFTVVFFLSLVAGCDRGNSANSSASAASSTPPSAAASVASGAAASTASSPSLSATIEVGGAYEAKLATVETPDAAPKFTDEPEGAIGPGEMTLSLPRGDGEVTGKASGALGAQVISGFIEGDRFTATARPDQGAAPLMYGSMIATVAGVGEARVVTGTMRASSSDGRIVREAVFTLKKR